MNRKTFIVVLVLVALAALGALYYFFLRGDRLVPADQASQTPCLVFQSEDKAKPCYAESQSAAPMDGPSQPVASSSAPASTTLAGPQSAVDAACSEASLSFERDGCVSELAQKEQDKTVCDAISSALAREACRRDVDAAVSAPAKAAPVSAYVALLDSFSAQQGKTARATTTTSVSTGLSIPTLPDEKSLQAEFMSDFKTKAPLAVYAPSKYQATPGESIKIYGSGFESSGNVLNIGSFQTSVDSADGATLSAQAPGAVGEYEIWVTNSKGSSRVASRPIKLTVTNSPQALPEIESASPSLVPVDGTVVLSGKNFGSSVNLLTSLGILMNVPSDGTHVSLALSSLPYISYAKATPELKGKKVSVMVNLQTSAGATEKIFQFDVQF